MHKYIHFYKNDNKNYKNNGDYIIKIKEGSKLSREINGIYKVTLIISRKDLPSNINSNIIKVFDGIKKKWQLFIINSVNGSSLTDNDEVEIVAYHITVLLGNCFVRNLDFKQTNLLNALEMALNNSNAPFILNKEKSTQYSNVVDFYIEDSNVLNLLVGDTDQCFPKIFNAEIEVEIDNYEIIIKDKIGSNNGYLITNGKNLEEFREEGDFSTIYTRIMPYTSKGLTLPELYVDSKNINNYPIIRQYNLKLDGENYALEPLPPEQQDSKYIEEYNRICTLMREEANKMYEINKIDLPVYSYTVALKDLINNAKYKDLRNLMYLNLGDTIKAVNTVSNINLDLRIVSMEWDIYNNISLIITLDNIKKTFTSSLSNSSSSSSSSANDEGLLGRVEDLEKGFSQINQEYNKVEFKFGNSNINRINNGAFLAGLKYWDYNTYLLNNKYIVVDKWEDKALNINSKTLNSNANAEKGYIMTQSIKLLKGEQYTFSFKYLIDNGCSGLKITLLESTVEDPIWKESIFLDIDNNETTKEDLKAYKDFKPTGDYVKFKIEHKGNKEGYDDYTNLFVTYFALYKGLGYKDYNYNMEIYSGITTIDQDGVQVYHKDINTTTRMNAQGFHILDNNNNVIGSLTSTDLNYTTLGVDYVYAGNVKTALKNELIRWNIDNNTEFNTSTKNSSLISRVMNDEYITEKNRENAPLYINCSNNYKETDNIVIEDFTGSSIFINLPGNGYIRGKITILNCTASIIINGIRQGLTETDGGTLFGEIVIKNCSNIQLNNFTLNNSKYSKYGGVRNNGITIEDSNVYLNNINLKGWEYGIESIRSNIWIKDVVGDIRYFMYNTYSNIYLIDNYGQINLPDYALDFLGEGNFINRGEYQEVKTWTDNSAFVGELLDTIMIGEWTISTTQSDWRACTYNVDTNENISWEEAGRKIIGGFVKNPDYNENDRDSKEYFRYAGFIELEGSFINNPADVVPTNTTLKVRLKPKTYSQKTFNCYLGEHRNTVSQSGISGEPVFSNYMGNVGQLELIKYNYISIPDTTIYNLINGNCMGLVFCPFRDVKPEEEQPIYIEAGSVKVTSILKWND